MIVYGRNAVREAIRGSREVRRVWATKNALREPWLEGRVTLAGAEEIAQRAGSEAHQGVCAEVEEFRYASPDTVIAGGPRAGQADPGRGDQAGAGGPRGTHADALIIVLDQIQDPPNLGAICRSAECAGAAGVVIPDRRAAEVTPAVCKASAGAVEHLPVARVRNITDFLAEVKASGGWCYGADAGGPVAYDAVDYAGTVALVLGSEGRGLRPRVAGACDALIRIPRHGRIESLSVSASAAVLMFAATRGRA